VNWSQVFNTDHKHWGRVSLALDGARSAGYKFMAWNGRILSTETGSDTGLKVEDLNTQVLVKS
jgi:hypothetical protein